MATIKKQGRGYKITVSQGYDINGKQIRTHMTWSPDPGMTQRQVEKELNRQAVLFEEQVLAAGVKNGNMKFADFAKLFIEDYASPNLKIQTVYDYEEHLKRINLAIGHIRLRDLRPHHLAAFYSNLQEEGLRTVQVATAKFDLAAWLKEHHISGAALARSAGVSIWAIKQTKACKPIAKESAEKLSAAIGRDLKDLYTITKNMSPLSASTVRTYHSTISTVLTRAVKWKYIKDNPAKLVDLPSQEQKEARYFEEADVYRLLELLEKEPIRWRTLITFDLLSGLRRAEIVGLRWSDIDMENRTVSIVQTQNYIPTKGTYTDTPKSKRSSRVLRVSRAAILILQEYQQWQDAQREKLGDAWKNEDGLVFTNDFGCPLYPGSPQQWFRQFIQRTGLPYVTLHGLRHTYASLMIFDSTPIATISKRLGHAQTSTTQNIYIHAIAAADARAEKTFDRFDEVILADKHQINTKSKKQRNAG